MGDKLLLEDGKLVLTTDEGRVVKMKEDKLVEMMRGEIEPPINGEALPDGVKFIEWQSPFLCVVHQLPAHVRQLRWITDDSPEPFGPGATFKMRRLSVPYAITFAIYYKCGDQLSLMGYNELYFRNEPLKTKQDKLGYPALLNVSRIDVDGRSRSWICTQYLHQKPGVTWTSQLSGLLDHTWNGAFNLSSEHHEGASWYGESKGVHKDLHPIDKWEKASKKNDAFALSVPWKEAACNVEELMYAMLTECAEQFGDSGVVARPKKKAKSSGIVSRFLHFAQNIVSKA